MSPYAVIPTNGILNKASQIFNWQSVSFKCRFISPVLHENKQGVLPYAIAFCVESGVLKSPRDFLKNKFYYLFPFLTLYPVHRHHTHPPPTRKTNT